MHRSSLSVLLTLLAVAFTAAGAASEIVINEIMYNSPGTDVEFVELINAGSAPIDITGWYMLDDDLTHPRCYLDGVLAAGDYLVVAGDLTLFHLVYPGVTNLNPNDFNPGGLGFSLGNTSDTVFIFDPGGTVIDWVTYQDGGDWPSSPDGGGPSLELINPILDNALPTSWDPSIPMGGTPGVINSSYLDDQQPICRAGRRDIDLPTSGDSVNVSVEAWDNEALASVQMYVDTGSGYAAQDMFDDGLHGDGAAGDSIWGSTIPPQSSGTLVKYYVLVLDDIGQENYWPDQAPSEYRAYTVDYYPPHLRITEMMAVNNTGITDPFGQHDDWIELYNSGSSAADLGGLFLSDNLDATHKFALPSYVLDPGAFVLVWADADTLQGPLHANFKLSASGEAAALFDTEDHGNVMIHGFTYGPQNPDISIGLLPMDGDWPEYLAASTPLADNSGAGLYSDVCINEFQTTSAGGGVDDWIELFNRGASPVDISGWHISDDRGNPMKWAFPVGTILAAGDFVVVDELTLGFSWSSTGVEVALLTAADGLTGMDYYDMGPQQPDISEGRYPDGQAYWHFFVDVTPGGPNSVPVGVGETPGSADLLIRGAWPNPFNPSTSIGFDLGRASRVRVTIHSVDGRRLRKLFDGDLDAGSYRFAWDGRDDRGGALPSGLYFASVRTEHRERSLKLVLIK